jgi:uncharacterized protein YndB with AHSA1/START domain
MAILRIVGIVLALAIAAVLAYAATRPDSFRVERTLDIKAPPAKIFGHINELRGWAAWSPYDKRDPAMKRSFSGPDKGKGAVYEWDGNNEVGAGRMEVLEATEPSRVLIKLDFSRPFEGHNTAEFTLKAAGDTTAVTWAMYGPAAFVTKIMGVFFNMDTMIGRDFEAGLANLKALAEKQ